MSGEEAEQYCDYCKAKTVHIRRFGPEDTGTSQTLFFCDLCSASLDWSILARWSFSPDLRALSKQISYVGNAIMTRLDQIEANQKAGPKPDREKSS